MYLRYFALQDHPFAITPDPAFLYLSAHHREALGHLLYGTGEHGGFVQLTGEVGTGKTTLIRALLEQEHEVSQVDVALCLNPQLTVNELLASICDELDVDYSAGGELTLKHLVDCLNAHLLTTHAAGRRTVLIIDEAQNLSREVLEQVRLLTNLETGKHKLLRIILVGQPELEDILARPDLRQLAQRITARFHLPGLSRAETSEYIRHRLRVAGGDPNIFSTAACAAVYKLADGTPRLINTICERALMGAYAQETRAVSVPMVRQAARETLPRTMLGGDERITQQILPVAVLLGAALLAFALNYFMQVPESLAESAASVKLESDSEPGLASDKAKDSGETTSELKASKKPEVAKPEPVFELPEGNASMSQLLRLWGVFGSEVNVKCRALRIGDLRCISASGSLRKLEQFNHPALLTLREGETRREVLLSNLDTQTATLVFAEGTREWPRSELARLWTGDYQMVWRHQTATVQIGPGSVGASVVWLRRRLAAAEGVNLDAKAGQPSPIFDDELRKSLKRFQKMHDLEVDGLVGSRTMIVLNNVEPAPGSPLLNAKSVAQKLVKNNDSPPADVQEQADACRSVDALPAVEELARLDFGPNVVKLSSETKQQVERVAEQIADDNETLYVAGTSYNPSMALSRVRELAYSRAQAVAEGLVENGISNKRLRCIARSGKQAPTPSMDRVSVIYRGLAPPP